MEETPVKIPINKIETYLNMFDRILIYNMVTQFMSQDQISTLISFWNSIILKTIDLEAQGLTEFVEGDPRGRALVAQKCISDGEEHRLDCLKQLIMAKSVIEANLKPKDQNDLNDLVN